MNAQYDDCPYLPLHPRDGHVAGLPRFRVLHRLTRFFPAITLLVAALIAAAPAGATPATPPISRTVLERHPIPGTDETMEIILVVYQPGVAAPLHHHSVAGLNYVLEGTAESAYGKDAPKLYHTGETFTDLPNVPHTVFRNADAHKVLRFLIFANVHANQPYTIVD
jgi:quercetin dioxygenase-like cupin family protein